MELIQQRGIKFSVTDIFLLELEAREADTAVVETLRQMRAQGKDFVPTTPAPSTPAQSGPAPAVPLKPARSHLVKLWGKPSGKSFSSRRALKPWLTRTSCPISSAPRLLSALFAFFQAAGAKSITTWPSLTYFEKKENYKILTVANRSVLEQQLKLCREPAPRESLEPRCARCLIRRRKRNFRLEGRDQTNGHETIRVGYQVPRETSSRTINYNNERTIVTAYRGRCWIDPQSHQVVRLEDKAISIPDDFPITRSEGAIDYDLADIAGRKYWLPARAEVLLIEGGAKLHTRNVIEFKRYRKFEAEVRIVPDEYSRSLKPKLLHRRASRGNGCK